MRFESKGIAHGAWSREQRAKGREQRAESIGQRAWSMGQRVERNVIGYLLLVISEPIGAGEELRAESIEHGAWGIEHRARSPSEIEKQNPRLNRKTNALNGVNISPQYDSSYLPRYHLPELQGRPRLNMVVHLTGRAGQAG